MWSQKITYNKHTRARERETEKCDTNRKYLLQQRTLKQANLSNTIFKEESIIYILLKVSGGAVLSQKKFLFPYDIYF